MLTSTRPNLKAQASTKQKTTINPRFTSLKTAITTLLARESYALPLPKHSFYIVIAALLHAKSIAFRRRKQHCEVTKIRKSLIDRQIQNTPKLAYLHTKNIPAGISQPANAVCKDNSEGFKYKERKSVSALLRPPHTIPDTTFRRNDASRDWPKTYKPAYRWHALWLLHPCRCPTDDS